MIPRLVVVAMLVLAPGPTVHAQQQPTTPAGPPPLFATVEKVNPAKREARFALPVLAEAMPSRPRFGPGADLRLGRRADDPNRLTFGIDPVYVRVGFEPAFARARWYDAEGKAVPGDSAWKALRPGSTVLLSADGKVVDPAYLRLLRKDTLVLVVPPEELPAPYGPPW